MHRTIVKRMVEPLLTLKQKEGFYKDDVVIDIRPTAEIARGMLLLGRKEDARDSFEWLLRKQHSNGGWDEVMVDGHLQGNTLSTAIIGESLAYASLVFKDKEYLKAANKGYHYVSSQEIARGHYAKTSGNSENILNVNATCAHFFTTLSRALKQRHLLEAREHALQQTVSHQLVTGVFPYLGTSPSVDPYYHSLTLYYLLRSGSSFDDAIKCATLWLQHNFHHGRLQWSRSNIIFTLGAIPSYAFSAYCFDALRFDSQRDQCLMYLQTLQHEDGLFHVFEPLGFFPSAGGMVKEWLNFSYPLSTRYRRFKDRVKRGLGMEHSLHTPLFYQAQLFHALASMEETT